MNVTVGESNFVIVGNHNLNLSSTAEHTGKYVKYYVRTDMTTTEQEKAKCSPANALDAASKNHTQ